ncbi:hypothetical protein [Xylanibacter muris]|uniref:Uncharacterized protein n=1 Tax=Xylanibacter muris TaxID=2736290 RepID=A0ABX2AM82_9BACT|nr:hypothetical protein [Xylanibacter muris]NPD92333.1 hypothetical protein [Xylanibacter muris]
MTTNDNIAPAITLSDKAQRRIQALREMAKEGTSHERIFLEILTQISCELSNLNDPDANRQFREYFDAISFYSEVLTYIVETE